MSPPFTFRPAAAALFLVCACPPAAFAGEPGKLTREVWNNVPGAAVDDLAVLPRFHGGPDAVSLTNGAVAPSNTGDNYGSRLRGCVTAPVTGDYTFWESGDDAAELWFAEGGGKFAARRVAWHGGWTGPLQWDKYPTQQAAVVRLAAGQKCYVELRHKEAAGADHLALAWAYDEVQVSVNLARLPGVSASQSSTYPGGSAANAIDGNTGGATTAGDPISHTNNEAGAWWQVDLGAVRSVDRVVLWNRSAWKTRLSNFRVSLLDAGGAVVLAKDFFTDGTHAGDTVEWAVRGAVNARVVRVEKLGPDPDGANFICLAEAGVFGVETPQPVVNLARLSGVSASQSSTYPGGAASNAIDGNTGGVTAAGDAISHTNNQAGAWWRLDLGREYPVESLVLWNRSTWRPRLSNFRVSLLDAAGAVVRSQDFFTNGTGAGANVVWSPGGAARARTVKVEKLGPDPYGSNFICLAEVEVFGTGDRLAHVERQPVAASALESYDSDPRDLDDDDLWDAWELAHGFNPATWQDGTHAFGADPDRDCLTNAMESLRGLDPFQPDSVQGFLTLEQRMNVPYYSVPEAAANCDRIYQEADRAFLVPGATSGEFADLYFAQRMRGYVVAPETGDYHFWLSASNGARLLVSTTGDKFHKRLVAEMGPELGTGHGTSFSDPGKWDRYASQMSGPVRLVAGEKYFIEVVHQHGHGNYAHADIAWARPGAGREEIPGEFLYSYFPVAADADDDSLPDAWEAQYGLSVTDNGLVDRSREGEDGDFDGDGLNNLVEFQLGTNPANSDTDGDGFGDGAEVRSLHTNPRMPDGPSETIAGAVDPGSFTASDYPWSMVDGGLVSNTFRGSVSWNFTVPTSGVWVIQVDSRLRGSVYANEVVPVNVSIDGVSAGRYEVGYGASHKGVMRVIVPDLAAGQHGLRLDIDNLFGRRMVQIDAITLRQPAGPDLDADGIPDWIGEELAKDDFVSPHAATSRTSPFCLEGAARSPGGLRINGAPVLVGADSRRWYTNLPLLSGGGSTGYTAGFANGVQTQGGVRWRATNVLDNETLTVREGDSLWLGAWTGGGNPNEPGSPADGLGSTITVGGTVHVLANGGDAFVHTFQSAGTYPVTASHSGGATGTLTVIVRHAAMPDNTVVLQNSLGHLNLLDSQAERGLFFETAAGLGLGTLESTGPSGYRFRLYPREGGRFGVVARLWEGGPVLDVADVSAVTLTDALENGLSSGSASQDFDGFYHLVTPMVVLGLPPGGRVEVTIYRAGVTFTDGTKKKTFLAADFTNGLVFLEFLLPAGMAGGYCHSITVFDAAGNPVGTR